MKKEDGVTLVSLVATVIVMLILATVTTYSGIESYKEAKKENFIAKMKVIQEKVDLIKSEYKNWSGYVDYDITTEDGVNAYKTNLYAYLKEIYQIETKVSDSDQSWIEIDASEEETIDDYYYFSTSEIKSKLGLDGFKNSNFELAINFDNRKVFEKTGITIDGTKYHSQYDLSDGQKLVKEETATVGTYTKKALTVKNYGLTADLVIENFEYTKDGQTLEITNYEYKKADESVWHSVTEFNGTNYIIRISESGKYIVRPVGGDDSTEVSKEVTLVNPPVLDTGMKAKLWDSSNENWNREDEEVDMSAGTWYSYNNNETEESYWANAVDESGNWWVWIPRFAYKIKDNTIKIEFLKGTSNTTTANKSLGSDYTVHPAFTKSADGNYTNGEWDTEITGFWVAKYQASDEGKFLPSQTIKITEATFTPEISNSKAHLMKASERGAVIYLTYGTKQHMINKNGTVYAGGSNSETLYTDTEQVKLSSTNNATGVYDLVTNKGEFVATKVGNGTGDKKITYYSSINPNVKGDGIGDTSDGDGLITDISLTVVSQTLEDEKFIVFGKSNNMFYCEPSNLDAGYRAVLITK